MTDPRALTDEERRYYRLNRWAWGRVGAAVYDVAFPMRRLRREVKEFANLPPGRILDVATGTGAQAFAFAPTARTVVGIDLSAAMLRIARRKNRFSNVTFQQADAMQLPFVDGSFDATCISFALHEMPLSVRERVLSEMARVTRPEGTVIVVDYGLPPDRVMRWLAFHVVKLYEPRHYVTFIRSDLESLLRDAGAEWERGSPALGGLARIVIGRRTGEEA